MSRHRLPQVQYTQCLIYVFSSYRLIVWSSDCPTCWEDRSHSSLRSVLDAASDPARANERRAERSAFSLTWKRGKGGGWKGKGKGEREDRVKRDEEGGWRGGEEESHGDVLGRNKFNMQKPFKCKTTVIYQHGTATKPYTTIPNMTLHDVCNGCSFIRLFVYISNTHLGFRLDDIRRVTLNRLWERHLVK